MKYRLIGMVCKNSDSWKEIENAAKKALREIPFAGDMDVYDPSGALIGTFKRSVEYIPANCPNLPVTVA